MFENNLPMESVETSWDAPNRRTSWPFYCLWNCLKSSMCTLYGAFVWSRNWKQADRSLLINGYFSWRWHSLMENDFLCRLSLPATRIWSRCLGRKLENHASPKCTVELQTSFLSSTLRSTQSLILAKPFSITQLKICTINMFVVFIASNFVSIIFLMRFRMPELAASLTLKPADLLTWKRKQGTRSLRCSQNSKFPSVPLFRDR